MNSEAKENEKLILTVPENIELWAMQSCYQSKELFFPIKIIIVIIFYLHYSSTEKRDNTRNYKDQNGRDYPAKMYNF